MEGCGGFSAIPRLFFGFCMVCSIAISDDTFMVPSQLKGSHSAQLKPSDLHALTTTTPVHGALQSTHVADLSKVLASHCALLCVLPCSHPITSVLTQVNHVFLKDPSVYIGFLSTNSTSDIAWKTAPPDTPTHLAFYSKKVVDRTCILSPPKTTFKATPYFGQIVPELLVQFLNEKCGTYRTITGGLNGAGLFHSFIMENLYHLEEMSVECPKIQMPDQQTFFQQFLFRSKPVVIENGLKHWPAMQKWTADYLREVYGRKRVHIKLTPDGDFEGVESATLWDGYRADWIPEVVRSQLQFPDLVVVRPATVEMSFSQFLDVISSNNRTYSAYLEYSSIPFHLPLLEEDISEMPFLSGLLDRRHLNIWLSDGNTLGKLHFDPFDNFLCQVAIKSISSLERFQAVHKLSCYNAT